MINYESLEVWRDMGIPADVLESLMSEAPDPDALLSELADRGFKTGEVTLPPLPDLTDE